MSIAATLLSKRTLSTIGLAVALSWGASQLIFVNAEQRISEVQIPIPVDTQHYKIEPNYHRVANFVGQVRAFQDAALGFEVSGKIATMPGREGFSVTVGDTLATLDAARIEANLAAAKAELDRIDADREMATLRKDRLAELEAEGLASKQAYDEARLAEQALSAARDAVQARLSNAQLDLEKSTLKAPYSGHIAQRFVNEGAVVAAGTPVLRLVAESSKEVHVGVPLEFKAQLQIGRYYQLQIDGLPVTGTLRAIRTDVDASTLTVTAVIVLPAESTAFVGSTARLMLDEVIPIQGGWLPISALIEGDKGLWNVLTAKQSDGKFRAEREVVEVIYARGDRAYVRGSLENGSQVITTGLQRFSPGSVVAPIGSEH